MSLSKKISLKDFDKFETICQTKFELSSSSNNGKILTFKAKPSLKMKGFKGPDYASKVSVKIILKAHKKIAEIKVTRINTELLIICLSIATIASIISIYFEFYGGIFLSIVSSLWLFIRTINNSDRGMKKFFDKLTNEITIPNNG